MILEARGLHHAVGPRTILHEVDITVGPGEIVGLVGRNGSGKSTALRLLHRALVPAQGRVLLEGDDLAALPARERARRIAVLGQEATGEMPLTVADAVLLGRIPHAGLFPTTTAADLEIATDALRRTGALHLARQAMSTLSGGERQRVLIARALAQRPRLLLMDEPTNHLDIGSQHQVLELVRHLGLATLVVLHDLNLAARYCDRVIVLAEGRVVADGPPDRVLTAPLVHATYGIGAQPVTAADGVPQFLFGHAAPTVTPTPEEPARVHHP
ncbi:ABC transporter ATP-binding protein [Brachybacterium sp. YJGR34]|uniref:ABC transporter ATP-binding protein n=1 Tax=Brachybacterium sp. YJGR34 TaxID=2059911 RepID=UPI000E0B918E|nr:ABC transporter ATP-binding protein [Brachybacterium sp. YJGR34]